jgi:hypothetical protein
MCGGRFCAEDTAENRVNGAQLPVQVERMSE